MKIKRNYLAVLFSTCMIATAYGQSDRNTGNQQVARPAAGNASPKRPDSTPVTDSSRININKTGDYFEFLESGAYRIRLNIHITCQFVGPATEMTVILQKATALSPAFNNMGEAHTVLLSGETTAPSGLASYEYNFVAGDRLRLIISKSIKKWSNLHSSITC